MYRNHVYRYVTLNYIVLLLFLKITCRICSTLRNRAHLRVGTRWAISRRWRTTRRFNFINVWRHWDRLFLSSNVFFCNNMAVSALAKYNNRNLTTSTTSYTNGFMLNEGQRLPGSHHIQRIPRIQGVPELACTCNVQTPFPDPQTHVRTVTHGLDTLDGLDFCTIQEMNFLFLRLSTMADTQFSFSSGKWERERKWTRGRE